MPWHEHNVLLRACLSLCVVAGKAWASPISEGDTAVAVMYALGQPDAIISFGEHETFFYPAGKVKLMNGRVIVADIWSNAEIAREKERVAKGLAERERRRHDRGLLAKQSKLADPLFQAAPAQLQVAYWETFRRAYPGVPVHYEYMAALQQALAEQTAALRDFAEDRRIADLEARVREAESRAAAAQRETAPAASTTVKVIVNPTPPTLIVGPAPVVAEAEPLYYAAPACYGRGNRRAVAEGDGGRRGQILGNRGLDRFPGLKAGRIGQASSVFRPPLPRPALRPRAFSPL